MWLHDWIIYHADYDESLTVYHPEGVLLNGSGVCESYALAYHMLLKEVGINSIFVAGSSRAQNHAWTLVQFDQEWCHIDPTWNDPIGINAENHDYFGLNDFLMNRDHDWLESDTIFPRSESLAFNYNLRNDYLPFKDTEELKELISTSLSARQTPIKCSYLGPDANFDLSGGIKKWMTEYSPINLVESSSYRSSNFNGQIEVKYRSVEGYHDCRNENEFSQIMDELLTAHEPLIKIYYSGNDLDFDLYRVMENWLPANYARYRVTGYNCSSSQFSLDMTVTYGE